MQTTVQSLSHSVQYNPFGSLETRRPDENRIMNDSNGSLIAVRCATCLAL